MRDKIKKAVPPPNHQRLEDIQVADLAVPVIPEKTSFVFKSIAFTLELGLIAGLLAWWFSSDAAQKSHNLWVLFIYSFPSEFIVSTVPHEPVLLYFAKFHPPWVVALVAISGTIPAEALNYTAFKFVADLKLIKKMLARKAVGKTVALFNRHPFAALLIAGFTPIPFYPFRFLVVLARYPLVKYLLAVLLSRLPRFYLLALLGRVVQLSGLSMIVLMTVLIIAANVPILWTRLRNRKIARIKKPDET